ncbi:MAG: hypothetical protein JSU94_16395 [Phycisphaerales bacterium]|nr:MAG: hypothetical protein JSU94_16395 [Phycisphaerales bacterium]
MLKLFLWLRYLRKKRIVFLSIAAVALSVSLLIVVASLFSGFISAFERSAVETMGDVILSPPARFEKHPLLIERLEGLGSVETATATLSSQGLLYLGKGNVQAVQIWGIEPGRRARVTGFKQTLLRQKHSEGEPSFAVAGSSDKTGGFVGIGLLTEPHEETDEYDFAAAEKMVGEEAVIITGSATKTDSAGDSPKAPSFKRKFIRFSIVDVVFTGVYEFDTKFVYLPTEQLQKALYPDQEGQLAERIQIKLSAGAKTDSAMAQIRGMWEVFAEDELGWGPYRIRYTTIETARHLQGRYVAALRKQMGVLLVIFGVVSFSVVVLVFCIFYMIVRLKQKDIAIIKSCGTTSSAVACVFLGFGVVVGTVGAGIGAVLGYVFTRNVNVIEGWIRVIFGLKLWKSSVYMFSKIPNEVDWNWAAWIVLMAIAAATIGAVIPALVAAATKPVEILRYE